MNSVIHVDLNTSPDQVARLAALQSGFSEVCNALAPIVQKTRCWNRVALHHLAYRELRERFPQMGSQMVCNAIYSVSRMCRIVYQHPNSPWNIASLGERALPLVQFMSNAPVYFDRHTLSLKGGQLSMYTLDGRIHFAINLQPADEERFHQEKLYEIVLSKTLLGYRLSFNFSPVAEKTEVPVVMADATVTEFPEYLLVKAADLPDNGTSVARAAPTDWAAAAV
jgi:hypothetical protein